MPSIVILGASAKIETTCLAWSPPPKTRIFVFILIVLFVVNIGIAGRKYPLSE
jgi:hypothetical protein